MRRERRFLLLIFLLSLKDLFFFLASHLCCSIFKGSFPREGTVIRMLNKSSIFFWRPKNPKILFRTLDLYTLFLIAEKFFRAGLNLAAVSTSLEVTWLPFLLHLRTTDTALLHSQHPWLFATKAAIMDFSCFNIIQRMLALLCPLHNKISNLCH